MSRPIFVIDDDEDVREVLCFALEFEGVSSFAFRSGQEAEAFLKTLSFAEYPGLMIVDFMMPEMDGVEFINRMISVYPDSIGLIPMALSTARFEDETGDLHSRAFRLSKPVNLEEFISLSKIHSNLDPIHISQFLGL